MIKVVNIKTHKSTPYDVYVGRPSLLGNPFIIGKDGDRSQVIEKYRIWLKERLSYPKSIVYVEFNKAVELARNGDVNLVCYCAPLSCHADIIKEEIERILSDE